MSKPAYVIIGLVFAAVACAGGADDGAEAESNASRTPPQRIISLIPSATETIVALGAADRLIARTDFDVDPELAHLPSVGQGLTPSLEQLTMLGPDLVVAWPDNASRSVIGRLEGFGVRIYSPRVQTLAGLRQATRELGAILDLESTADSLIEAIDAELQAVRDAVAGRDPPSVFYVVWYEPPTTSGAGTYIDELIEVADGRNIFADAPGLWPQVSMEEIVRRQPDIVLISQTDEDPIDIDRLQSTVGWRELRAVREGRVFQVDANLYNRPGPNVVRATRQLARILHPEALSSRAPR